MTTRSPKPLNVPGLEFKALLGHGGMASVWKVWDANKHTFFAAKVLDQEFATSGPDIRHFMGEVRTLSQLEHPNIVRGYGADFADGHYYYLMEYVDGYSFADYLARKRTLSETDALIACESVADAMAYAWETAHVVHCDIKPENLMINTAGVLKITDFGLCRSTTLRSSDEPESKTEVVGTPAYMSPEQVCAEGVPDFRSDMYNLGASLYHLVTGRVLFPLPTSDEQMAAHADDAQRAPDPRRFRPNLSKSFVRLLKHLLAKRCEERPATWDDVADAAEALQASGVYPALSPELISSIE